VKQRVVIERIPAPLASLYEKATRLVIESYYRGVAEEIVSSFKGGLLLDLGTGPGYLPIEIVKRSSAISCDGIDLSGRLIKMARRNAMKAGVDDRLNFEVGNAAIDDRLNFEVGNAANLRFENESYDMVISTGMLHMLKDPVKVLMECYRVLRPGGEAWIYDPARVSSQMDKVKWKASLNVMERLSYALFKLYLWICPPHTYDREQVEEMIAATQFKEYEIEEEADSDFNPRNTCRVFLWLKSSPSLSLNKIEHFSKVSKSFSSFLSDSLFWWNVAHGMLGHCSYGKTRIYPQIGGYHRSVHHIHAFVTIHSILPIDDT